MTVIPRWTTAFMFSEAPGRRKARRTVKTDLAAKRKQIMKRRARKGYRS